MQGTSGTSGLQGTSGTSSTSGSSGTSGTSGESGESVTEITISGTQNNVNKVFTLASALTPGAIHQFYLNGQLLTYSSDYTISSTTLTFSVDRPAPSPSDVLRLFGSIGQSAISGTSGTSGTRGTSGTSGVSGANGTSGTSGVSGANGTSGTSGTRGTSGTSGTSGNQGTSGTSGVSGVQGTSGTSALGGVTSIAGTANQIAVSAATGAVTVSLTSAVIISGNMTAAGFFESSDIRLKEVLKKDGDVIYFKWKDGDDKQHIGYIAQEKQETHPDQVDESNGYLTLNYTEILVEKVRALEKELANLKNKKDGL